MGMGVKGAALALVGAVVLLVGCGGSGESVESTSQRPSPQKEWRVTLDSIDGPENVSVLMALHRGFFEDAGLDVWAGSPLEPNRPASYVAKGTDDFGLLQMPQLVIAREKGLPLVALGSVISQPTAAMIWLEKSGIAGLADLRGKTIAIPGAPFQRRLLEAVLARAGLTAADVEIEKVGYNLVGALLGGGADAIFGGSQAIEGTKLEARGGDPVVTGVQDLGVPAYEELVVVTRSALVAKNPEAARSFMTAVLQGTSAAVEDPGGAVDAIVQGIEANPPPNRSVMEAQMAATKLLLSKSGYMDPDRVQALIDWMYREGLIARRISAAELLDEVSR
jgi:putative hydroxymethylpyrimidine transport system substrate-binding protein